MSTYTKRVQQVEAPVAGTIVRSEAAEGEVLRVEGNLFYQCGCWCCRSAKNMSSWTLRSLRCTHAESLSRYAAFGFVGYAG